VDTSGSRELLIPKLARIANLGQENNMKFEEKRKKLLKKYKNCACCKSYEYPLIIDHIIPQTDERCTDNLSNLQVICRSCNSHKGNREIIKYDRRKKYKIIRGGNDVTTYWNKPRKK
jgi:5-methylcytosine-specific restriction endonuclease McrA